VAQKSLCMEGVPMNGKVGVNKCNQNGERSQTGGHGDMHATTLSAYLVIFDDL